VINACPALCAGQAFGFREKLGYNKRKDIMSVLVLREKGLPAGRQGKTLEKNLKKIFKEFGSIKAMSNN